MQIQLGVLKKVLSLYAGLLPPALRARLRLYGRPIRSVFCGSAGS